eukprot:jgi/Bigna1/135842/aug1.31_g10550
MFTLRLLSPPRAVATFLNSLILFMMLMSIGAAVINGFALGWTPDSRSSSLWEEYAVKSLGARSVSLRKLILFMRTETMCKVIYSIISLHLCGVLYKSLFSRQGKLKVSVRLWVRNFIRTSLLPTVMILAYITLADKDYAAKMGRAAAARANPAKIDFASILTKPPTTFEVAHALTGGSTSDNHFLREGLFIFLTWLFYYVFIHVVVYGGGFGILAAYRHWRPQANTLKVPWEEQMRQMLHSEKAFPMYAVVPTIGDIMRSYGFSQIVPSFAACGGVVASLAHFVIYMFLVEGGVFFVHYWLLHKWEWGRKNLNHDDHHLYIHDDEMTTFTGYAFEPIDASLQGLPFVFFQFVIPVPEPLAIAAGAFVGFWTMYIHVSEPDLPWPFMGAGYHLVHHQYNWFNFGLFTMLWDYLHNTLRHPGEATRAHALKTKAARTGKANRNALEKLHQMWSDTTKKQH